MSRVPSGRVPVAAILATVAVALVVVAGLIAVGPPSVARERLLDEQRRQDLATIAGAIRDYARRDTTLPQSLDALTAQDLPKIPRDPSTKAPYTYTVTGRSTYRLCATFQHPTDDPDGPRRVNHLYIDNGVLSGWHHGIGYTCFDRTLTSTPLTISH